MPSTNSANKYKRKGKGTVSAKERITHPAGTPMASARAVPKTAKAAHKKCNAPLVSMKLLRAFDLNTYLDHPIAKEMWEIMIELGRQKDVNALKFILEKVLPPGRSGCPFKLNIGHLTDMNAIDRAMDSVIAQMEQAELSPEETKKVIDILVEKRNTIEQRDLISRLDAMKQQDDNPYSAQPFTLTK